MQAGDMRRRLESSFPSPAETMQWSKRVMGIEPTYPAWKAGVLPLNYTRAVPVLCTEQVK